MRADQGERKQRKTRTSREECWYHVRVSQGVLLLLLPGPTLWGHQNELAQLTLQTGFHCVHYRPRHQPPCLHKSLAASLLPLGALTFTQVARARVQPLARLQRRYSQSDTTS